MMKKSLVLVLLATIFFGSFGNALASVSDRVMASFQILPDSCNVDSDKAVTRAEFSYTLSHILGSGTLSETQTPYRDVTGEHPYSGYIRYACVNGFLLPTGDAFCPEDAISFYDFNAAVVKLLAYEGVSSANGGGKEGDLKTVMSLQLYRGVELNGYDTVSVKQYRKLIYNLLTTKISDFSYSYDISGAVSLNRSGNSKTVLSEYFHVSRYRGTIVGINPSKPSAQVKISANISVSNPVHLVVGSTYTFLAGSKVDLSFYENVPVELWVNENEEIVYIAPDSNVEVFYDVIYSVNNDISKNPFHIRYVNKIEFNNHDKVYAVASNCELRYNGNLTSNSLVLAGKYAKITLIDNKVTALEIWELTEGGLITSVTNDYLTYQKGEGTSRISNLSRCQKLVVVIDGISTDRSQLKENSVFSYYKSGEDTLILVVSEKMVIGTFDSMGNDELEIGMYFYGHDSTVYFSEDGKQYKKNAYESLFGCEVAAYSDCFGYVKYVKIRSGQAGNQNRFEAYLIGSSQKGLGEKSLKLQKISPVVEEVIYPMNDRVVYEDGLSEASLTPATKSNAGHCIYSFELNSKGEIKKISKADHWNLFGDVTPAVDCEFPLFENETRANIYIYAKEDSNGDYTTCPANTAGRATIRTYLYNPRYVVVYELDGKLCSREVTWNDLLCKISTNVKVAIFADEESFTPELILVYGNTENIASYTTVKSAVITKISHFYDTEADKEGAMITVVSSAGEEKLALSLDTAATLRENMYLQYRPGALFTEDGIMIETKTQLPSDFSQWASLMGYYPGTVRKISKERVFLQGGKAYQLKPDVVVFGVNTAGGNLSFKSISFDEIEEGDSVLCSSKHGVGLIFVDITGK